MSESRCNLYNVSLSNCFADTVAARLLSEYKDNPLELADVLLLLPNRRAVKSMAEAFVRAQGLTPTLLPKMLPLGDVEEDELFLTGLDSDCEVLNLPPAIERNERLLLFTKIIMAKPGDFGLEKMPLSQACYLAQELANLIDTVNNEDLSFDNLQNLVPSEYAAHWQETLKFLEIITRFWPEILQERNLIDPSLRRNLLLKAQSVYWAAVRPDKRIIIAGTSATYPAMRELVKTVMSLPRGEVILPGLDKNLSDEDWLFVDETHPQFEFKQLLDYLQIERSEVKELAEAQNIDREILISEIMRPAKTTDRWRNIQDKKISHAALDGLSLIDCADIREEALVIALIMREALETPEQTAALITADRNLARRVASELERWNIKVDDSAGRPLSLTPVGSFLRLAAKVCESCLDKIDLLSLLKHPLCNLGRKTGEVRRLARMLEQKVWRGGIEDEKLEAFETETGEFLREMFGFYQKPRADFKQMLEAHLKLAEKLAATESKSGAQLLWKGDAGEAAAKFFADLYDKAEVLGEIDVKEYLGMIEALMSGVTVRPKFGTHPRLKILGPIEARLTRFDVTVIGGVNETVWPKAAGSDPWLSRPMKKDFGFPQPEKAIGIMARDFAEFLGAGEVYLTRSERVQGTPMVRSRWWLRLETVLKALGYEPDSLEDVLYRLIARDLDRPEKNVRIAPPSPKPPVSARPREMSASNMELWMRDPYSIFAKYILKLRPLDEINQDLSLADYGNIIHAVLEEFNNKYPSAYPENAEEELFSLGRAYFDRNKIAQETRAFWWPNFEKTVRWLVEKECSYRRNIKRVHNEVSGKIILQAPAGEFTVTAKADRVDETIDGRINIIDYKTGKARSKKEVENAFAPQLPIEGLIAENGGFENIGKADVAELIYWQPAKKETIIGDDVAKVLNTNLQRIAELIHLFDFETTPYLSRPNPKRVPEYSDYEHLARVKEWSLAEEDEGE